MRLCKNKTIAIRFWIRSSNSFRSISKSLVIRRASPRSGMLMIIEVNLFSKINFSHLLKIIISEIIIYQENNRNLILGKKIDFKICTN